MGTSPASGRRRRPLPGIVSASLLLGVLDGAPLSASVGQQPSGRTVPATRTLSVVREVAPASDAAERAVRDLGGTVTRDLPIIDGCAALIPADKFDSLGRSAVVRAVAPVTPVQFDGAYGQGSGGPSAVYSEAVRADRALQGVAPGTRIISLKITGRDGSTDITHVMAALQWAVERAWANQWS